MRRPHPDDVELKAAIRPYVVPETDGIARYLWLLGADFRYLDTYLPQLGKRYDQPWALGALLPIDQQLGTDYATRFIAIDGLWQQWDTLRQAPAQLRERISDLCSMAEESMRPD